MTTCNTTYSGAVLGAWTELNPLRKLSFRDPLTDGLTDALNGGGI